MRRIITSLVSLVFATSAHAAEAPKFVSESVTAGIDSVYHGAYVFMAGAGVASFDCSGDDVPELFFAGGTEPAELYQNDSQPGAALKFTKLMDSGLGVDMATGGDPLNIDGDQHTDLVILRVGENLLMRGKGNCTFERANEAWNFDGGDAWTTAFSATWEKDQQWPTLALGNFMDRKTIILDYGNCDRSFLFRPSAQGGYGEPIDLDPGHCALSMLFSDWNRDGVPDLRVSNDKEFYRRGEEQLFRLSVGEAPRAYTREDGWNEVNIWGMGIASADVTGDGYPEYYLTNMTDNRFETLNGDPTTPSYGDRSEDIGISAGHPFTGYDKRPSTAWHAEFNDVNNDCLQDLLVVKGNVEYISHFADADPNNLLIQQPDGSFTEGAEDAGILSFKLGRGGALVDLNDDGMLDLVVTNRFEPAEIWRNVGAGTINAPQTMGNWVSIRLDDANQAHAGVGSWIEIDSSGIIQRREVTVGGGHAGGQWGATHVGIGDADEVMVRAQWPDGAWSAWHSVPANQHATINREENQFALGNEAN